MEDMEMFFWENHLYMGDFQLPYRMVTLVRNRQLTQVAFFRCLKTGCDAQTSRLEPQHPRKKKKQEK